MCVDLVIDITAVGQANGGFDRCFYIGKIKHFWSPHLNRVDKGIKDCVANQSLPITMSCLSCLRHVKSRLNHGNLKECHPRRHRFAPKLCISSLINAFTGLLPQPSFRSTSSGIAIMRRRRASVSITLIRRNGVAISASFSH